MTKYLFLGILLFLPLQFALNIGENFDLVTTRLLVPVVFFLWLLEGLARKKIWAANRMETWLIVSFLFLSIVSLWGGLDPSKGIRKIIYLFSLFPIYFVAADLFRNENFRIKTIKALWMAGALAAIVGIGQFLLPFLIGLGSALSIWKKAAPFFLGSSFGKLVTENPSWLVNVSGETWMRAFGTFADPHMFSFFVSLCFFAGLGYFAWEKKKKWNILAGIAVALMFFAIMFSFARGAYLGVAAGSLFFTAVLLIRSENKRKNAAIGAVFIFLAALVFQGTVRNRFVSAFIQKEGSNMERMKNWREAYEATRSHPFSGVGLGNYSSYVDPSSRERSSIYAHNLFLDIAAETGILNGIVFLGLILACLWRNIVSKKVLNLGIASGLVYYLVHSIFDTSLWAPQVMVVLLVMLAVGLCENNLKFKSKNEK